MDSVKLMLFSILVAVVAISNGDETNECWRESGIHFRGNDIDNGYVDGGEQACANWCGRITECRRWSLRNTNWCWIKTSNSGRERDYRFVSGTKGCARSQRVAPPGDCYEQNRDYPGNDINLSTGSNEDRRNSASECQDLCKQREGCKYFTWKEGSKECWLKTVGGPGNHQADSISGPKTCGL